MLDCRKKILGKASRDFFRERLVQVNSLLLGQKPYKNKLFQGLQIATLSLLKLKARDSFIESLAIDRFQYLNNPMKSARETSMSM